MSFLVILLFLGGIIVLFVYICTLISRIKIIVVDSYKYFIFIVGFLNGPNTPIGKQIKFDVGLVVT